MASPSTLEFEDSRDDEEHKARVEEFRRNLATEEDDVRFVRRHILHGNCYALNEEQHYRIKERISSEFSLELTTDLHVVGSARLGFSIAPNKRYNKFHEESDIDIAVVSHELYCRIWHELRAYKESGAYWRRQQQFEDYLSWGWIRPDMLPVRRSFPFTTRWWEFLDELQAARTGGPYKVRGAIYHDLDFLLGYQANAVKLCRTLE